MSASCAVMRFEGLTVNILLMRFFASGVTVSHSGEGYCNRSKYIVHLNHGVQIDMYSCFGLLKNDHTILLDN